jgi:hypothetical protein
MKRFRVEGTWYVLAKTSADAENAVEDAVARGVQDSELDDCNAEEEDNDHTHDPDRGTKVVAKSQFRRLMAQDVLNWAADRKRGRWGGRGGGESG